MLDSVHALGTALLSQEGHCSFLPLPSQGREGSHTGEEILTLCLNSIFSSKVMVSALAITGMMFTTLLRCFMNSRSKGRRLQPKREQHGRGHFTLLDIHPSDSPSTRASKKSPFCVPYFLPPSPSSHPSCPPPKPEWHFSCPCYPRLFQAPWHPQLSQTVASPTGRTPWSMAEMKQSRVYICHKDTKGLRKGERLCTYEWPVGEMK